MAEGDTFLNAVIGALVTVVLAMVPFSPVVGGIVAGYLNGHDKSAGTKTGALSGLLSALPMVLVFMFIGGIFLAFLPFGLPDPNLAALSIVGIVIFFFVFLFIVGYSTILGAFGGYIGAAIKDEDIV